METNFNFNSAICTSLERSRRLLALGLKKETADFRRDNDGWNDPCVVHTVYEWTQTSDDYYPCWSLHRLIEMTQTQHTTITLVPYKNTYDAMIGDIESLIKEGYFNKEYLV